ncbi:MAG: TlpA disulfide reductase family protein [Bacteroidota bacterium]
MMVINSNQNKIIMIFRYKILFTLILAYFFSTQVFAQTTLESDFNGKFYNGELPDSLVIRIYKNDWLFTDNPFFIVKVDKNGEFKFNLEKIRKPLYFRITKIKGGKTIKGNSFTFYAESGDKLNIKWYLSDTTDSLFFTGTGADKYNLIWNLERQFNEFDNTRKKIKLSDTASFYSSWTSFMDLVRQYDKKKRIEMKNAMNISLSMKELINYNYANYYEHWRWLITNVFTRDKQLGLSYNQFLKEQYNKFNKYLSKEPFNIAIRSPRYITSLAEIIKSNLLFEKNTNAIPIELFYYSIVHNYNGLIRERLLAELFRNPRILDNISQHNPKEYDNLLQDAWKYSSTSSILKETLEYKGVFKTGEPVYDPGFVKLDGSKFNLSELRGKVVLLKMWVTGCGGCIMLQTNFEKYIQPNFKDNPAFAVVSVNIDKPKKTWIESLGTKKYSTMDVINVNTGGLGLEHPFIQHYHINATPFILLIDKEGKIYAKIGIDVAMKDINGFIENAINSKSM